MEIRVTRRVHDSIALDFDEPSGVCLDISVAGEAVIFHLTNRQAAQLGRELVRLSSISARVDAGEGVEG